MQLTTPRVKFATALALAFVLAILSAFLGSPRGLADPSPNPQLEVTTKTIFDGTAPNKECDEATDPADGGGTGKHTPGLDCSTLNQVVRTWDLFSVRVDWDVNEQPSKDVTLTVSLASPGAEQADVEWAPDQTGMFTGCGAGSAISADGLVLTCKLGDRDQGSHGTIRPTARLKAGKDGTKFTVSTTVADASGATPATATPLDYYVSERPSGNWIKNKPVFDTKPVTVGGEKGYVVLFPMGLTVDAQTENPARGSGSIALDPLTFYDHAWNVAKSARLAEPDEIAAANAAGTKIYGDNCGMYDAQNAGAFPVTQGSWTCGPVVSPNGYPVWEINVKDYSGEAPATNADGTKNSLGYVIMGQLVLWMPASEVDADFVEQGAVYNNTVSANVPGDNLQPGQKDTAPIQIIGVNSSTDETGVVDNTNQFAITTTVVGGGGGGGGNFFSHYGQIGIARNYQYRILESGDVQRVPYVNRAPDSALNFDGKGTVSRGTEIRMNMAVGTAQTSVGYTEPIHGCMRWDPTQIYLTPMGDIEIKYIDKGAGTEYPGVRPATDPFSDLIFGTNQGSIYKGPSSFNALVEFDDPVINSLDIKVEYGYETGATTYKDSIAQNSNECNNGPNRVWVDSKDKAGLEARAKGDGTYQFDMVRVRINGPFPWATDKSPGQEKGDAFNNGPYGSAGFYLAVSGRIGTDLDINPNGKSVYIHTSRAHGEWDPAKSAQPPSNYNGKAPTCVPDQSSDDVTLDETPRATLGWCNQAYNVDNENLGNKYTLDEANFSYLYGGNQPFDSDTDRVTIVSVRPEVVKTNDAGVVDVANNGQLVKFTLKLKAVGSPREALTGVVLEDVLPPEYQFVSVDKYPVTPNECTLPSTETPGGTISCVLSAPDPLNPGNLKPGLPGQWTDEMKITVLIKGAVASPKEYNPITNTANLNSTGLVPWDPAAPGGGGIAPGAKPYPADQTSTGTARSYLPLASDEAAIIKSVNPGLGGCTALPDGTALTGEALAAWQKRCSIIPIDPDTSNGTATDTNGNMTFSLSYSNTGNTKLTDIRIVDVLPFIGDGTFEPPSNSAANGAIPSTVGDARSPGSDFKGTVGLVSATGAETVYVTKGDPSKISRDPDAAVDQATWCQASEADPTKWEYAAGPAGDCPTNAYEITALYMVMPDLLPDATLTASVTLDTEGSDCNDIWTNTFGLRTAKIDLPVRSNDVSVMAGCQSVGDFAWLDTNRNGLQDNGEPAVAGVTVNLYDESGALLQTTKTDAAGYYSFQKLVPSTTYTIEFVPIGKATFTKQNASGDTSNSVTDNTDPPLAGTAASAKKHGDSDVDPATGKVTFTTSATIGANLVSSPTKGTVADNPGLDAGFVTAPVSIGDYVWIDVNRDGQQDPSEPPVPGVTVNLYAADGVTLIATTKTDENGYYAFNNLFGGLDYVVEFVPPTGATFTVQNQGSDVTDSDADPKTGRVNVTAPLEGKNETAPGKTDNPTFDAGFVQLNLVLKKAIATPAPYTPGQEVTFELTPSNEGPADAIAGWSVTDLLPAGLTFVSASGAGYTCEGGKDDVGDTVTCTAASGLVAGATGAPISVKATIDGYFVGQLKNVAYVTPDTDEITETNPLVVPTRETDTDTTPTDNDAQALLSVNPVSIGDYVWWDVNRDGLQQDNEPPIEGITVTLYLADGVTQVATTTTDANGFYSFTDLAPNSDYLIRFGKPDGGYFTLQTVGDDRAIDSNPDDDGFAPVRTPADGKNSATEPDDPTYDAGYIKLNLNLIKERTGPEQVEEGDTVIFALTPHNDGPVDALAGWSVTDLLPAGLAFVSASGDGYTCASSVDSAGTSVTCVAAAPLLAGTDGPTITLVTRVAPVDTPGAINNVAYVQTDDKDIPETIPLERPTRETDTDETPTDNDAQAPVELVGQLPKTGGLSKVALPLGVLLILVAGGVLILGRRRIA